MRPQPHPPFPPLKVVLLFLFNSFSGLSAHLSYSRTYRVVSCHLEALWTKHVLNMHLLVKGIDNLTQWESAKKGRMGRGIRHRVKKEAVLNGTVRDRRRKGTKATWIRTHDQNSRWRILKLQAYLFYYFYWHALWLSLTIGSFYYWYLVMLPRFQIPLTRYHIEPY